jgi:iron complex outermembrane receptor protein
MPSHSLVRSRTPRVRPSLGRNDTTTRRGIGGFAGAGALLWTALASAAPAAGLQSSDLANLSLEELSNIEITSVSRHAEPLSRAPAAIYVITSDDIRRSGVTSLPEALRLAPNLQVARVGTGTYAISARGFNNAIGNKLLVLIDGRTVYTPLFSGVNWDSQFVMLEDVERIEVISGPGGTLWGANAVNGVINVITRTAQNTQGALIAAGTGNRDTGGAARYGGKLGDDATYRIYAMGFDRQNTAHTNGTPVADGWTTGQAGFRVDWSRAQDGFTLQGDAYKARSEQGPSGTPELSGANLVGRWAHQLGGGSSFALQAYYDHTERDDPFTFGDKIDLFDVEFQHAFAAAPEHRVLWGGGYRYAYDDTLTHFNAQNPLPIVFMPASRSLDWGNVFVQDEIALRPEVNLTLGLKAETNVYTHVEYLPSARLAWNLEAEKLLWAEISRAVRAPARIDREFFLYLQLPKVPLIPIIKGGPDVKSEVADVAEIGYRAQPTASLSYSVTTFYSYYDKLRSGQPPPAFVQNMMYGTVYGVEAWGTFQATPAWRLSAGLVGLHENLKVRAGSTDPTGPSALGNDPKFQCLVRSSLNASRDVEFDVEVRHVGALPNPVVAAYTAVDARLGWRPRPDLELSLTAQNLFDRHHVEFGAPAAASEIDRGVFFKVVWRI